MKELGRPSFAFFPSAHTLEAWPTILGSVIASHLLGRLTVEQRRSTRAPGGMGGLQEQAFSSFLQPIVLKAQHYLAMGEETRRDRPSPAESIQNRVPPLPPNSFIASGCFLL